MTLNEWYEKAIPAADYIEAMEKHKENTQSVYNSFTLPQGEEDFLEEVKKKNLRAIVLTEDWCGDAMVNVPILLRLAEKAGIETKMLLRDQNLELMDQYLTNGTSRSIPIFIFLDKEGEEFAVWGPRAEAVQRFVDEERAKLPAKDHPGFEEQQRSLFAKMTEKYTGDEQLWKEIYESIKSRLQKA